MSTPTESRNCPYCLNPVTPEEDRIRCPKCGVTHHAECWKTYGKCSVYGCDGWAAWSDTIGDKIAPPAQDAVIIDDKPRQPQPERNLCIRCGVEVGQSQLLCRSCWWKSKRYWMESCTGPSLLVLAGVVGGIAWIVRAVLT